MNRSGSFPYGFLWGSALPIAWAACARAEPPAPPSLPLHATIIDADAIAYGTFQSHNQKVVSNRNGIFVTYVRSANKEYTAQEWRLARSTDGGKTFGGEGASWGEWQPFQKEMTVALKARPDSYQLKSRLRVISPPCVLPESRE